VFGLAVAGRRLEQRSVLIAMGVGLAVAVCAHLFTPLAWTWLTPLGAAVTLLIGWVFSRRSGEREAAPQPPVQLLHKGP
jgi:hypothetical protein